MTISTVDANKSFLDQFLDELAIPYADEVNAIAQEILHPNAKRQKTAENFPEVQYIPEDPSSPQKTNFSPENTQINSSEIFQRFRDDYYTALINLKNNRNPKDSSMVMDNSLSKCQLLINEEKDNNKRISYLTEMAKMYNSVDNLVDSIIILDRILKIDPKNNYISVYLEFLLKDNGNQDFLFEVSKKFYIYGNNKKGDEYFTLIENNDLINEKMKNFRNKLNSYNALCDQKKKTDSEFIKGDFQRALGHYTALLTEFERNAFDIDFGNQLKIDLLTLTSTCYTFFKMLHNSDNYSKMAANLLEQSIEKNKRPFFTKEFLNLEEKNDGVNAPAGGPVFETPQNNQQPQIQQTQIQGTKAQQARSVSVEMGNEGAMLKEANREIQNLLNAAEKQSEWVQYSDAILSFERILEIDENHQLAKSQLKELTTELNSRGVLKVGKVLCLRGRTARAKEYFDRIPPKTTTEDDKIVFLQNFEIYNQLKSEKRKADGAMMIGNLENIEEIYNNLIARFDSEIPLNDFGNHFKIEILKSLAIYYTVVGEDIQSQKIQDEIQRLVEQNKPKAPRKRTYNI